MFLRRRLACSFCGRGHIEVRKLVAGPKVYICDACVAAASDLMNDDARCGPRESPAPGSLSQRLIRWLNLARRRKQGPHLGRMAQPNVSPALR